MKSPVETHPFPLFVPTGAQYLILGTFPTHRKNWKFEFFYPGRNNFFWRLMSDVTGQAFIHNTGYEAVEERRQFLIKNKIALYDTIYKCRRIVAASSKDSDLEVVEHAGILSILKKYKSINTVILTSSSGPVSAHSLFFRHLSENNTEFTVLDTKPPVHGSFWLGSRKIETHTLYSTSGTNIGRYKQAVEQYRQAFSSLLK